MNNCTEYLELVSAYADDELTEFERRRVEEHLSECEDCSALLVLYREISDAVAMSSVPVPEILCGSVMKSVLSGDTSGVSGLTISAKNAQKAQKADASNRQKVIRIALTRYLPVAACLAVMLVSLPWIINYLGRQTSNYDAAPMSAEMAMSVAPSLAQDNSVPAGGQDMEAENGQRRDLGGAAGEADESGAAGGSSADSSSTGSGAGSGAGGSASPPPAEPAADINVAFDDPEASDGPLGYDNDAPFDADAPEPEGFINDGTRPLQTPEDAWVILGQFGDAYAWIEITGPLPNLLIGYEPEPLGGGFHFEMYYKIPSDVARELIDEILSSHGIAILPNNPDSDYAIVLYSPEG